MVQGSDAFGAWDGWVLYTSEDGHKYHWNHLTHESRWAVEQRADDRHHAEESFQAYIRQRTSATNPDKHRADSSADRLDNVEAGDGDDDDHVANKELREFVTPRAGVGPIAMSVTDPDRAAGRSGIAGRVSDALRKAMESVERPRQDAVGDRSASEQDPELGQKKRSKRQASRCYYGHKGDASGGDDSSGNSSSSSSECSNNSGPDGAGSSSRSGGTTTNLHLHERGEDNQDATRWQPGRDHTNTSFSKDGGPRFEDKRSSATGKGFDEGTRRSHRSRRHGRRCKGKARTRELESLNRCRAATPLTAEVLAGLGRQAVGNAVRITVRAVLGGWKGMTTVALRAVRQWQINGNLGGAVLPIAVIPGTCSKDSHPETTSCQLQDDDIKTDSAQVRPFLPNASGPPQHFRSSNRFGMGTVRSVPEPERRDITEGFREEDGEAGRWVGGDGGVEEQQGRFTSPP